MQWPKSSRSRCDSRRKITVQCRVSWGNAETHINIMTPNSELVSFIRETIHPSIIDFHITAFMAGLRAAEPSNIPLFPIVNQEDIRNNGTLRDLRVAPSRCIIHRRETSTATFDRARNAKSTGSFSGIVIPRDNHPRGRPPRPRDQAKQPEQSRTELRRRRHCRHCRRRRHHHRSAFKAAADRGSPGTSV